MITEAVVHAGTAVVTWMATLFPVWAVPEWMTTADQTVNSVTETLGGLGAWVDWVLLFTVVTAALGTYAVCFVVKLVLRVASYLPLVGGAG